jgi:hypothetical protein
MTRLIGPATRVYAALLRLYPPAFAREFAPSMTADFSDFSFDLARERGGAAVAAQWIRAALDLAISVPGQWLRQPSCWACAGAALAAAAYLSVTLLLAASIPIHRVQVQPGREEDALLGLIMLTALFPIIAVILFVWWFLAPLLRPLHLPRRRRA